MSSMGPCMSLCQSSRTSKSRARPAHTLGDHLNALAMSYYLALISPSDSPVYESHFTSSKPHNQIVAASTSTFPSWSSFPGFSSGQQSNQPQGGSVNSSGGAPAPPPKDPFPPNFSVAPVQTNNHRQDLRLKTSMATRPLKALKNMSCK